MDNIKLELMGLWLILNDAESTKDERGFIHRDYVKEKIARICMGSMNFHPSIQKHLTVASYEKWIQDSRNFIK